MIVLGFIFLGLVSPGVLWFTIVGTVIWVGFDANHHKLGQYESSLSSPTMACLGTIVL